MTNPTPESPETPKMTADVELLPLPEPDIGMPGQVAFIRSDKLLQEWCRANVLHHTTTKDTETEALRAEVERLEKALRAFPAEPNPYTYRIAYAKAQAAFHPTSEQENDDA